MGQNLGMGVIFAVEKDKQVARNTIKRSLAVFLAFDRFPLLNGFKGKDQ